MNLFNFINHPIESYIKELPQLYPGITNAVGCYFDYDHKLKILSLKNGEFIFIDNKETIRSFIRFNKKLNSQTWLNGESLPFNDTLSNKKQKQMSLEDEDNNSWLALKTKSNLSSQFDVFLLKINNSNAFGVNYKLKNYNTAEKALISNLINSNFQNFTRNSYENYSALSLMNKSLNNLNEIVSLKNKNNDLYHKKYREVFIQYIDQIIQKRCSQTGVKFTFNKEYIDDIVNSKLDISQIENTIIQSTYICINSNIQNNLQIELKPEYLIWPNELTSFKNSNHRDNTIVEFLDRYEMAAFKAHNQGLKIIGKTVGECCVPRVTAASISFNLKKYENKIYDLFSKNKEEWPTLRNQFNPIKKIINNNSESISNIKIA